MEAEEEIKKQLAGLADRPALSLVADIGNYVQVFKAVAAHAAEQGAKCIYITCTLPSKVVLEQLGADGIGTEGMHFIDCISPMVGSATGENPQVVFIESPTMLETMMLKLDMWLKKLRDGKKLVFLDSVSALAMHNDGVLLSEFLHYLVNSLRSRGIRTIILSISEQTPEDLETALRLVCDETLVLKSG